MMRSLKRVFVVCAFLMHGGFLAAVNFDPPLSLDVTNWDHVRQYMAEEGLNANDITTIKLKYRDLRAIPHWIFSKTPNVIEINMSDNEIESVPSDIGLLRKLKTLELSDNKIHDVHRNIRHAQNLRTISLPNNKMKAIPEAFYHLPNLVSLLLSRNQIEEVSPQIANLQNLEYLGLTNNPIRQLPPEMGRLSSLKALYLMHTSLVLLPKEIAALATQRGFEGLGLRGSPLGDKDEGGAIGKKRIRAIFGIKAEL